MFNLLKKEFRLAMHPTVPIMLLLSAMVLIPNYPYSVIFFYVNLSVFFTCLSGRENGDIIYTMTLPLAKSDIVKGRMAFTLLVQLAVLILMIPLTLLRGQIMSQPNAAGMEANIALLGEGLLFFAIFNLVFFTGYYKDVKRVGISFVKASVLFFLLVALEVVSVYAIPFVRDCLDTPDPQFMTQKLIFLGLCALASLLLNMLAYRISVRRFEKLDL